MIREKHLVPGRVLAHRTTKRVPRFTASGHHLIDDWVPTWEPFMVVSYYPDISRRHSRKTAPVNGWEVLVLWLGQGRCPVERIRIPPESSDWKLLW